jgi:hypothetical protein
MPPLTAVLFQTHFYDRSLARVFRRLQRQCPPHFSALVLIHVPPGTPKPPLLEAVPHHFVTTPEIRQPAYTGKSSGGSEWRLWDGNADLPHLHFFLHNRQFERYWSIEYDVRFSGSWQTLFEAFEDNDADLLTTSLRTAATHPDWIVWSTLRPPNQDAPPFADHERICSFMPVWRASRRAMEVMDRSYREGWTGHSETTWPTLLNRAGLRIEDIGGFGEFVAPANRGRFYSNTVTSWNLAPGSFVYKWCKHGIWWKRDWLWHPVKPVRMTLQEDMWRLKQKLLIGRRWLAERVTTSSKTVAGRRS